jgi:hypothetical protein
MHDDGRRCLRQTSRCFAAYDGGSCAAYPTRLPVLFVPYGQGASAWPPADLPGLLHLARIERAPDRYLEMAQRAPETGTIRASADPGQRRIRSA